MLGIRLKHTTVVTMEQNETVARETGEDGTGKERTDYIVSRCDWC
jgi:hypothetical protein